MDFFEKWGKKLTADEMLELGIEQQEKLLNGEKVLNNKNEPIRSWFRDGRFIPSIGIFVLFEGQTIAWKKGTEIEMINDFKTSLKSGKLASYIKAVDKKLIHC
jgi:hypothetical protein